MHGNWFEIDLAFYTFETQPGEVSKNVTCLYHLRDEVLYSVIFL